MNETFAAGGVVLNKNGEVMVVSQRGTSWSLPKGHIDEGEDDITAARREILEESGVSDLSLIHDLGSYTRFRIGKDGGEDQTELKHIHIFLFSTNEMELRPQDPHNPEARWVTKEEVADLLTHPKDKEFFMSVVDKI